jgi:hypothetical protein
LVVTTDGSVVEKRWVCGAGPYERFSTFKVPNFSKLYFLPGLVGMGSSFDKPFIPASKVAGEYK